MSFLPAVKLWLWFSAFASFAGWTLSAVGELNELGYGILFGAFAVLAFLLRREIGFGRGKKFSRWKKSVRRFRRPLPLCFLALAILVFIGGVIYPPSNYTAISYRIPRVLQWLSHDGWFWIHTPNFRMNDRAVGFEWLAAPLLLFTKSTRGLFLINFIPFLLMPGLIFSVFTRIGVHARVARQWMWLLPTGYNFLLHAGSAGNDAYPAMYGLAMLDLGCRAWQSRRRSDLWQSLLAAGLLMGCKASNLPLLLPWLIVVFPLVPLLRRKLSVTALMFLLVALVSFLPTAILNAYYCGDWTGAVLEYPNLTVKNPVVGLIGNTFQLLMNSFVPPIFPLAGWWNQHATEFLPKLIVSISQHFDLGFFFLGEVPTEDWSALGLGLNVLLLVSVIASFRFRSTQRAPSSRGIPPAYSRLIVWSPWIALLAFFCKSGLVTIGRLLMPYFPLLLPLLLAMGGQALVVRRRWWKILVGIVLVLSFVVLAISPDRPLWPAKTILSRLQKTHPDNHLINRALKVYTVYSQRADVLSGVRDLLPAEVKAVGFIGSEDDADLSLWLPLGQRTVKHFFWDDPPEQIRAKVNYVVIGGHILNLHTTIDAWLQAANAELVAATNITMKISEGEQPWYVVRFR